MVIMEAQNNDFEARISQLGSREIVVNQQIEELKTWVEELVKQKEYLTGQLELVDNKRKDINNFCDQSYKIQEQMHHFHVILTGIIYKVSLMMA